MSHKISVEQSHPVYVFVVLSLAAFVTLFTFCRRPGITYEVQATLQSNDRQLNSNYATHPATISRQRGGSISSANLNLMLFVSCLVGGFGLLLARRSRPSSVLSSPDEVDEVAGIPVVANFAETIESPERKQLQSRRRVSRVVLRVAEVAVAAVFLLIVFNLATQETFFDRFVSNPFAAYGEVLTSFIG